MISRSMEDSILAAIAAHAPAVIIAKSLDGRFRYANGEFLRLFHLSPAEVAGKTYYDLMPREVADSLAEHDKTVIARGAPGLFDEKVVIDGELRIFSCLKFPLRRNPGAIYGLAGISVEITARKELEREIQIGRKLAEALNSVNALVHSSLDVDEIMASISQVAARAVGASAFSIGLFEGEYYVMKYACCMSALFKQQQARSASSCELCDRDRPDLLKISDWRRPLSEVKKLLFARSPRKVVLIENIDENYGYVFDFLKNSDIRSVMLAPLICRGELNGTLNFYYSSPTVPHSRQLADFAAKLAHSVSLALENARLYERIRNAEEAARKREEQLRIIADFAYDWEYWIDPEGKHIYVSPACEKVTGHGPEDFLKDSHLLLSLVHPGDQELFEAHRQEHLQGSKENFELEFRIVNKAGETRWISHACLPVYGKDGRYLGRRASNRDITEQKKTEEELLKAQKLESIGLLAGGIAHDFNNFLTAILGNITLAKLHLEPGSKAFDKLAMAERASFRARGLTQQLLTFAKGGVPVRKAAEVEELVRDPVELALRGSNVRGEYQFSPDLRPIEVDEGQFHQVISNLVINAVQAMPAGGVLKIRGVNETLGPENHPGLPADNYVRIDVEDQGVGIPENYLDKIFDPYFTTQKTGSGLGLAIAYSIIKKHGGVLTVHSTPGKGSVFSIYLPASLKEVMPKPEEKLAGGRATGRILIMDDNEFVAEVAADMLQHLGYETETARDGAEAVSAFRQARERGEPFDAVITDLTVAAGMGGRETLRRLLELDPAARVIVSSGYAEDPIMSEYAKHGFKGVIPKPYRLEEMSRVMHEVLGKGS